MLETKVGNVSHVGDDCVHIAGDLTGRQEVARDLDEFHAEGIGDVEPAGDVYLLDQAVVLLPITKALPKALVELEWLQADNSSLLLPGLLRKGCFSALALSVA